MPTLLERKRYTSNMLVEFVIKDLLILFENRKLKIIDEGSTSQRRVLFS